MCKRTRPWLSTSWCRCCPRTGNRSSVCISSRRWDRRTASLDSKQTQRNRRTLPNSPRAWTIRHPMHATRNAASLSLTLARQETEDSARLLISAHCTLDALMLPRFARCLLWRPAEARAECGVACCAAALARRCHDVRLEKGRGAGLAKSCERCGHVRTGAVHCACLPSLDSPAPPLLAPLPAPDPSARIAAAFRLCCVELLDGRLLRLQ